MSIVPARFAADVDFGRAGDDYARHRAGFPERFFAELEKRGLAFANRTILDIGTGTGTLARGFAARGGRVCGVDPSAAMLHQARSLAVGADLSATWCGGRAETLPFPPGHFDLLGAGQCWHWFRRPLAAREAYRVLRPGGHIVIAHFDWVPLPGNLAAATETLIRSHNPHWVMGGGNGFHPAWAADLAQAGFHGLESFSFDIDQPYSHEGWRGRMRASAGVKASLDADGVAAFDRDLAALLAARFPAEPLQVLHRIWALIAVADS